MSDGATLIDQRAIVDHTIAYCWAIDTRDWEALRGIFARDVHAELGRTVHHDVEGVIERCRTTLDPLDASQHSVSNHQVTVDGDRATCRCYFRAQHVRSSTPGGANYMIGGVYDDRLERVGDGWRITHRVLTVSWTEGNPAVTGSDRA